MIDWDSVGAEAGQLLSGYLKQRSVNPPGDERVAAEFLAAQLRQHGMEARLYTSAPNRVNLTVRLPGNGSKKPILLYNHMDVVEADPQRWSCDPFGGEIREGYVWGRGAIDMKGMGIMQLMALDLLRQNDPERTRDVLFLAAADEEEGGRQGAKWMIDTHWPEIEAEYVWDEGGFGLRDLFGPAAVFTVAVAEKKELWLKLVAHGEPGLSSVPGKNNAANILMNALNRVMILDARYELNPVTQQMFAAVSRVMSFPASFLLNHLHNPLFFRLMRKTLSASPTIAAMLKDTLSITVLRAGLKRTSFQTAPKPPLTCVCCRNTTPKCFWRG